MPIRISQATTCADRTMDEQTCQDEFVQWWWNGVRVLEVSVLGFLWWWVL